MSDRTARRFPQGRPSKGERHTQSVRFPVALYEEIKKSAEHSAFDNVNDFVVDVVARAHAAGMFPAPSGQLPLPASA